MNAPAPIIAACVVSWNTADLTLRCLDALSVQRRPPDRVVVVDNASSDDSVTRIRRRYPQHALVTSANNVGFAAAVALAAAQVPEADALWLLNSDTQAEPEALDALLSAWRAHGDALYGGLPLRSDAHGREWLAYPAKFLAPEARWSLWRRDAALAYNADWRTRAPLQVGALVGSALLIPTALLRRHGGMDPGWFLYCEEIDYCLRLRRAGIGCWLVPSARVWHDEGGSHADRTRVTDVVAYYRARNEILLARRHFGFGAGCVVALKKGLRALALAPLKPHRAAFVLRGAIDAARGRRGKTLAPEHALAADLAPRGMRSPLALLRRWRARLAPAAPTCAIDRIGAARIAYAAHPPPYLRAWQRYCVALLRQALVREPAALDIVFEDAAGFGARARPVRVGLQWEHTLVRPGGRDSAGAPAGRVPLPEGEGHYLARLARREALERCDLIIDYSRANLENLRRSGAFDEFLKRCVALAPLLHEPDFDASQRDLPMISLMHDLRQTRRGRFLDAAHRAGLPLRNVRGVYAPDALRRLHRRSRVLVNLHQTDDHHTFEELRVLPALLCGVVVVSEDVPLREHIPYADFIVWSRYEDLIDTARDVDAHYAQHRARLFDDARLKAILAQMRQEDETAIMAALRGVCASQA